ncbi:MAG TPA: endonuclease/exonuclease/phosphatase family protein [Candidatus Egerieimonas faecigallinarum]|nr:endonuclease/exonuclease/phosphatase family protein [Candidatus Egerieimonas faecigallinarum]
MKIVTFNIRYDTASDEKNAFHYRRDQIARKIKRESPDIICFQEVLPHVAAWLKENLKGYYVVGCGRSRRLKDEQTAIAFKAERMNLIALDTYWLSDTPQVPGSRYEEQSVCPRICTEAVFQDLEEDTVFRVVNVHLDHADSGVRGKEIRQVLARIENEPSFPGVPVILAGDFYSEPDSEEIQEMHRQEQFEEVTGEIGATYHGFGMADPMKVDYIFIQKPYICTGVKAWTDCRDGVYLSDHYPLCAELSLETAVSSEKEEEES